MSKEKKKGVISRLATFFKWGLVVIFVFFGLVWLAAGGGLDGTNGCVYVEEGRVIENAEWLERINNEPDGLVRAEMMLECQETQQRIINRMSEKDQAMFLLESLKDVE